MFFPLDENTEEAGVTEITDLSKDVAKPIQNPNVTHQNKAFTYDILKTRLCVLPPHHVQWVPLKSLSSVASPQNQEGYKHPEKKRIRKTHVPLSPLCTFSTQRAVLRLVFLPLSAPGNTVPLS